MGRTAPKWRTGPPRRAGRGSADRRRPRARADPATGPPQRRPRRATCRGGRGRPAAGQQGSWGIDHAPLACIRLVCESRSSLVVRAIGPRRRRVRRPGRRSGASVPAVPARRSTPPVLASSQAPAAPWQRGWPVPSRRGGIRRPPRVVRGRPGAGSVASRLLRDPSFRGASRQDRASPPEQLAWWISSLTHNVTPELAVGHGPARRGGPVRRRARGYPRCRATSRPVSRSRPWHLLAGTWPPPSP